MSRSPSDLALNLAGIDGVAKIVARPVGNTLHGGSVAGAIRSRRCGIKDIAYRFNHTHVGMLAAGADVVALSRHATAD